MRRMSEIAESPDLTKAGASCQGPSRLKCTQTVSTDVPSSLPSVELP